MIPRQFFPVIGLMALLTAALALAPAIAQEPSPDDAIKAAYLTKFIPFIDWPEAVFASPTAPLTICVLGTNSFGENLDKAASGAKAGERAVMVHRLAAWDPDASCQLLFIGGMEPADAEMALDAVRGHPVVTVTDPGAAAHGVIAFVVEQKQVRFDIDDALAAQGGLSISSKLLGLARNVKQRGQP